MTDHFALTDREFEDLFQSCAFPEKLFSHEAHLRLAYIHVKKYGREKARENITGQLKKYVEALGAASKYNETLTVAAVKAVAHFIVKSNAPDFSSFIQENPRLKFNFKELMSALYQLDIYNSSEAKARYIAPDLLPFD